MRLARSDLRKLQLEKRILEWSGNLALAGLYFFSVHSSLQSAFLEVRISTLLLILFNTSVIILALIRHSPRTVAHSSFIYLITFCGTLSPLLFRSVLTAQDETVLIAVQLAGIVISYAGLLSLKKSFGLLPADRGIVTTGMYRFVRHPLYTGYLIQCMGFLLQNRSTHNMIVFIVFVTTESLRLVSEEQHLSRSEEYAAYRQRVPWRIIPHVW